LHAACYTFGVPFEERLHQPNAEEISPFNRFRWQYVATLFHQIWSLTAKFQNRRMENITALALLWYVGWYLHGEPFPKFIGGLSSFSTY
jgi:hypothetical protein